MSRITDPPKPWAYDDESTYKFMISMRHVTKDVVKAYHCPYCNIEHFVGRNASPKLPFCWRCGHEIDVSIDTADIVIP